jgi:hypothetical protein
LVWERDGWLVWERVGMYGKELVCMVMSHADAGGAS